MGDDAGLTIGPSSGDDAGNPFGHDGGSAETGTDASCGALTACGAGCVDTASSAQHCGRCGRSCGAGSACQDGRCAPITLASNLTDPTAIAVGPNALVINVDGALVRCGKDGCAAGATRLWTGAGWVSRPGALSLSADGAYAFTLASPESDPSALKLSRVPIEGAPQSDPSPVMVDIPGAFHQNFAIATDDREHVFASPYRNFRCFTASCLSPVILKQTETPTSIALSPSHYVWTSSSNVDGLFTCARPAIGATSYGEDCGTEQALAPLVNGYRPEHLVVHDSVAYWTETPIAGGPTGRVLACALSGCNKLPKVIASGEGGIGGLAVDATGAYWTIGSAGSVRACRDLANGCGTKAETLASGATEPAALQVDAQFVFYIARGSTAGTGAVMKVAK